MQLGPYLEVLKEILAKYFNLHNPVHTTTLQLKFLFDALDHPEFLSNVPKVSLGDSQLTEFVCACSF